MWKVVAGFVVFSALALWLISQGGDIDMSGEKHGIDAAPAASAASQ